MKLNVGQWYTIGKNIDTLLSKDLPARTAYKLSRLAMQLAGITEQAEKQRTELVKKHGTKSEDGQQITVQEGKMADFMKEWEGVASVPEDVKFDPITIEELGDVKISPAVLMILDPLFVQQSPPETIPADTKALS